MYQTLTPHLGSLAQGTSDYDRVGGYVTVNAVVDDLCDRVLHDPALGFVFRYADPGSVHQHQMGLVTHLLGGPVALTTAEVRAAYGGVPVSPQAFGAVAEHLVGALRAARVPEDVVLRAVMALVPVERQVARR